MKNKSNFINSWCQHAGIWVLVQRRLQNDCDVACFYKWNCAYVCIYVFVRRLTRGQEPRWQPGPRTAAAAGCSQSPPCAALSFPCEPAGGSWGSRWYGRTLTCGRWHHLYSPVSNGKQKGSEEISQKGKKHTREREGRILSLFLWKQNEINEWINDVNLLCTVTQCFHCIERCVCVVVCHRERKFTREECHQYLMLTVKCTVGGQDESVGCFPLSPRLLWPTKTQKMSQYEICRICRVQTEMVSL